MFEDSTSAIGTSSRTPKATFTSRLRLNKSPVNHRQEILYQRQQYHQTQQSRQQQSQLRQQQQQQRYVISSDNTPSAPLLTSTSYDHNRNRTGSPSQHPSQYPLSAIQALQEAGLAQLTPTAKGKVSSSFEAGNSFNSMSSNSRRTSFELSSSGANPSPLSLSQRTSAHSNVKSLRSDSLCSDSSSEFSLSAAFADEERIPRSSRQSFVRNRNSAVQDHSRQSLSGYSLTPSSQYSDYSELSDSLALDCDKGKMVRKSRTIGTRSVYENDDPKETQKNIMALRRKSKTAVARVLRQNQAEGSRNLGNSITRKNKGEGEMQIQPRLRKIALASLTISQKSPPPPLQRRRTRTIVPPSPVTPRQGNRTTVPSKLTPSPTRNAPLSSPSMSRPKATKLEVTRPPRSLRRTPSPLRALKTAEPSHGTFTIEAFQDDDGPIFDLVDGIRWEMLKKSDRGKGLESGTRNDSSTVDSDDGQWGSIEQWRSDAKKEAQEVDEHSEKEQGWQDEVWDETVRGTFNLSPNWNQTKTAPMPSLKSDLSMATAQSFQSMSSMGLSVFTALNESPNSASTGGIGHPSTSTSPDTAAFSPLITPTSALRPSPNIGNALSSLPGAFPGLQSSQSLLFQPSKPIGIATVDTHSFQTLQASSSRLCSETSENLFKSPRQTASNTPSEVYESADEGTGSGSSPLAKGSVYRSPRVRLSQQYNAQKRASRMFGLMDKSSGKGNLTLEEGEARGPSNFCLTSAQLVALSEEAELGLLDPAELRRRHDHLLTREEGAYKDDDQASAAQCPLPELWRQSNTSREDESIKTFNSGSWETHSEQSKEKKGMEIKLGEPWLGGEEVGIELDAASILPAQPMIELAPTFPLRPAARRRSKQLPPIRKTGSEEGLIKPITATFLKLSTLPIQLVEAPVQISWRSSLTTLQYEEFANTFGSKEMHRQEVIEELSITEWNFVANVSSILHVFSMPLRKSDLSFTPDVPLEIARLFNWLDDILAFHVKLLKSLDKVKTRHPSPLVVSVAGALNKHMAGLSIHQSYLVNFERVTKLIDDVRRSENKGDLAEFDRLLERQSRLPECRGMGLSSFLLKPVQRLMKYPLFFKQLAELTPVGHPDHQESQVLCSMTEKIIRDINCVKAKEEDYHELKLLESRIKGLPEGFHLASRQRHLLKQGSLRSLPVIEQDKGNSSNPFDRSFANASPVPASSQARHVNLTMSSTSFPNRNILSLNQALSGEGSGQGLLEMSPKSISNQSPTPSESHASNHIIDSNWTSFYSALSSGPSTPNFPESKRYTASYHPPIRPTSRKTSMANLFARTKQVGIEGEEETTVHAFVFDDLLLLATSEKEEEKEAHRSIGRQSRNKKKQGMASIQASPTLSQLGEDNAKFTVLMKGGLSRILGVTSRVTKGMTNTASKVLEVEVLPLNMSGEGPRSSGSAGSMVFIFAFAEEVTSKGGVPPQHEMCSSWEKAMERSFLSCIQARKKQSIQVQPDLSSPIFGSNLYSKTNLQSTSSLNTAQADWPRRKDQVTQVVMNAARCGDRTTLTALLQAGLPFPRSPSQQNLSDLANRTVAMVETNTLPLDNLGRLDSTPFITSPPPPIRKSPSQLQLQLSAMKKSPVLGSAWSNLNVNEVARVGDLGIASIAARTLDEERREEKTWWSLRLKEIEAEGEWNDALEKLMDTRRSRLENLSNVENVQSNNPVTLATRVRKGLPVLKPLG